MKLCSRFCSLIIILLVVSLMHVLVNHNYYFGFVRNKESVAKQFIDLQNHLKMLLKLEEHRTIVDQFFEQRKVSRFKMYQEKNGIFNICVFRKHLGHDIDGLTWFTSNLGTYLFKNIDHTKIERMSKENRIFNIMIWKHWKWLKYRHGKSTIGMDGGWIPFHRCNVDNCRFSDNPNFDFADAVVVHIQYGLIPQVKRRDPRQIWIFLTDESPQNTFSFSKKPPSLSKLTYIFNWSMTYRTDSDVPVPYGRTVPLPYPKLLDVTNDKLLDLVPYWKMKQFDVLATILISNCNSYRMNLLHNLMLHISVDIHGECAANNYTKSCPGYIHKECEIMSKYLFYLVFENAKCRQYLTEKSFHHAYGKGAIPVIMGPPVGDCNSLLPPNSFLHVDQFKTPKALALEMIAISTNVSRFLSYHAWRNHFEVINEHGFFETQSFHLCRICQALNYNDGSRKVYDADGIRLFLDHRLLCNN